MTVYRSRRLGRIKDHLILLVGTDAALYTLIISVTFLIHAGAFGQAVKETAIEAATKPNFEFAALPLQL